MIIKRLLCGLIFMLLFCSWAQAYDYEYAAEIFLDGKVSGLAVNPDSDTAVAICNDINTLFFVDVDTGAVSYQETLEFAPVSITINQVLSQVLVGTSDQKLLIYDLTTRQQVAAISLEGAAGAIEVTEDGGWALVGINGGVLSVDLQSGEVSRLVDLDASVTGISVIGPLAALAMQSVDGAHVQLLDIDQALLLGKHPLPGNPVSLSQDEASGMFLLTLEGEPGLYRFNSSDLEPLPQISTNQPVEIIAVNPSTHMAFLTNSAEGALSVIDLERQALVETVNLFENLGPISLDVTRNLVLAPHDHNIAFVQMENPVPEISGLIPEEGQATGEGVPMSIFGSKFIKQSEADFNARKLASQFEDNELIITTIPEEELLYPGDVKVAVSNPLPGGGRSNELNFKILTPLPVVESIEPAMVAVGSSAFKLKVRGKNFLPASHVNVSDDVLNIKFLSSTLVEVTVNAAMVAELGTLPVSLTNEGTTSLTSNTFALQVVPSEELEDQEPAGNSNKGFGSLEGRILNTETFPLMGVRIKVKGLQTQTDGNGYFRLDNIPAGKRVVLMDGSSSIEKDHYPTIPITVDIVANKVNPMPFQPYFHKQKNKNFVHINPAQDTVLTDPELPGFELRIPKGVNITGWDGQRNLKVSVRTVPIHRLPIKPPPKEAGLRKVYMYYFDKIGGGVADQPIPVKAKNDLGLLPGEKAVLWYFDESPLEGIAPNDWAIAGTGTVSPDGKYIVTDPGVGIPKFCCGASGFGGNSENMPPSSNEGKCAQAGDPVDMYTGYFMHEHTDLVVPGIIPVKIKRYYRSHESGSAVSGADGLGLFGKGTYFEYDWTLRQYGAMYLLVRPGNYQHRFDTQQPDGSFINETDPMMRGAKLAINGANKTLRLRDGWSYTFNSYGDLVELADRNGNKLTFVRRSNYEGRYLNKIITVEGNEIVFNQQYVDGNFFQTNSIVGPFGRTLKYTYEKETGFSNYRRLTSVASPDGLMQYSYDDQGRMSSFTNPRGVVEVVNEYYPDHRVKTQTHSDGGIFNFSYLTSGEFVTEATMSTPNSAATTWKFNTDGYLTEKVTPDGSYIYDKALDTNELKSVTDPLLRTASYTYYNTTDARNGQVETKTDPLGRVTTYEYEPQYGLPTRITIKKDAAAIDLLSETSFNYTFDPVSGGVVRAEVIDALQNRTVIDYNVNGFPSSITTPDTDGDPANDTTTIYYDSAFPSQIESIIDPLGNTVQYAYNNRAQLSSVTNARGITTRYGYNPAGRVSTVIDPLHQQTRFFYDANGNLVMMIDAKGQLLRYEYDDRDRLTKEIDQQGREEIYTYYRDAEITPSTGDNLKSILDRKGQLTTFDEYDASGRLKKVTFNDGSAIDYLYDAGGRVKSITDSISGQISYTYEDLGCSSCGGQALDKVKSETTLLGTVEYDYDDLGRRKAMRVPGSPQVDYGYDELSRLKTVTSLLGGAEKTFNFDYDAMGRRLSQDIDLYQDAQGAHKLLTTYEYDAAHRLVNLLSQSPAGLIENLNYNHYADGNRSEVSQVANIPLTAPVADTSYGESNELTSFEGATLNYDENGNLTEWIDACGTTVYNWDVRNRLESISGTQRDYPTCTPLSASFYYDALNRRTEKIVNGTSTQYLYDGVDIVQTISDGQTTDFVRTLNIDEPLAMERNGQPFYYHADGLGSIVAITDASGNIVQRYSYEAFGQLTASDPTFDNFYTYTGREYDKETGLYYYRARYYDAMEGRFISKDPIGFAGGDVNLYAYVWNSPVNYIDPWGLAGLHTSRENIIKGVPSAPIDMSPVRDLYCNGGSETIGLCADATAMGSLVSGQFYVTAGASAVSVANTLASAAICEDDFVEGLKKPSTVTTFAGAVIPGTKMPLRAASIIISDMDAAFIMTEWTIKNEVNK